MKKSLFFFFLLIAALFVGLLYQTWRSPMVRGKFGGAFGLPTPAPALPEEDEARNIALAELALRRDAQERQIVAMGVLSAERSYFQRRPVCAEATCKQVNLYDFARNEGITVLVNLESREVLDIFYQPHNRPFLTREWTDRALTIALNAPEVIAELGFKPDKVSMAPNDSWLDSGGCENGDVCLAATFDRGERNLWAIVNLNQSKVVRTYWTQMRPAAAPPQAPAAVTTTACPAPGLITRDGWSVPYQTTASDGLHIYNVTRQDERIINSAKVVEWHVRYPPAGSGFIDTIGCGSGSGFPITPYGETQIQEMFDSVTQAYLGFELIQDFRNPFDWGQNCSYRYQQQFQFYTDGSYRVVMGAFGRGCGSGPDFDPLYIAVMRIDAAVGADDQTVFDRWDGQSWHREPIELWLESLTTEKIGRIAAPTGDYYEISSDYGLYGDDAPEKGYLYVTRYYPEEGATDLGGFSSSTCCYPDHRQGPHEFIDGDVIDKTHLVLWYAPLMQSHSGVGVEHCWTVQGEPNPITYPCFGGLRFRPIRRSSTYLPLILHKTP